MYKVYIYLCMRSTICLSLSLSIYRRKFIIKDARVFFMMCLRADHTTIVSNALQRMRMGKSGLGIFFSFSARVHRARRTIELQQQL